MGLTKSELFTTEQNKIADICKVIGHPARVAILQHLLKVQQCICGDLVDIIDLSQPTISQHLRELKRIDLISGNIEGTKVCYCINVKTYKQINKILGKFFGKDIKINSSC